MKLPNAQTTSAEEERRKKREGAEEKEVEEGEASIETVNTVCGAVLCPRSPCSEGNRQRPRKQRFSKEVREFVHRVKGEGKRR